MKEKRRLDWEKSLPTSDRDKSDIILKSISGFLSGQFRQKETRDYFIYRRCFESPSEGLLPEAYLDRNDSCVIDSLFHDSSGISWYHVKFADNYGWIKSDFARLVVWGDQMQRGSGKTDDIDIDKKRRYRILFEHQDWPRRIQKFVREGRVCLGMTEEQLRASWGEPVQKSTMFMLGLGDQDVWFYKSNDGKMLIVGISERKVSGWSGK